MKLFDLHADIGYSVLHERKLGKHDVLKNIHLPKRIPSEFSWICMASFFDGKEDWAQMQEMILTLKDEISKCEDIHLVNHMDDLKDDHSLKAILSVEGMCGIQDDVETKIDWLYEQGVKVASLTWNDENALATGAKGSFKRGLSELGIQAVKRMAMHRMILDVSHANEATFWDILHHSDGAIIATHSNARALCDHPRNLYDEQLIALANRGGIVGVVTAGFFVFKERKQQDITHLVDHIRYLKELIGIDHIAFGFDFMDDFENAQEDMLIDLDTPKDAQRIIVEMRRQGFQEEEIKKVAYENALQFFIQNM